MNRQMKRLMQRQGQVGADGAPVRRQPPPRPAQRQVKQRTSPAEFVREVRAELRKVAWPTRAEVTNYSIIVLVAVVVLTILVGFLDYSFGEFVVNLFSDK